MPMRTGEQLQSIMPRLSAARNSELLPFLTSAMAEFAIEAPATKRKATKRMRRSSKLR